MRKSPEKKRGGHFSDFLPAPARGGPAASGIRLSPVCWSAAQPRPRIFAGAVDRARENPPIQLIAPPPRAARWIIAVYVAAGRGLGMGRPSAQLA